MTDPWRCVDLQSLAREVLGEKWEEGSRQDAKAQRFRSGRLPGLCVFAVPTLKIIAFCEDLAGRLRVECVRLVAALVAAEPRWVLASWPEPLPTAANEFRI